MYELGDWGAFKHAHIGCCPLGGKCQCDCSVDDAWLQYRFGDFVRTTLKHRQQRCEYHQHRSQTRITSGNSNDDDDDDPTATTTSKTAAATTTPTASAADTSTPSVIQAGITTRTTISSALRVPEP